MLIKGFLAALAAAVAAMALLVAVVALGWDVAVSSKQQPVLESRPSSGAPLVSDVKSDVTVAAPTPTIVLTAIPRLKATSTYQPRLSATPPQAQSRPTWTPLPRPTYTPRARPTYTPHPTPTRRATAGEAGGREAATPFAAYLLDGSQLALADTLGSPTLLAFWAPW